MGPIEAYRVPCRLTESQLGNYAGNTAICMQYAGNIALLFGRSRIDSISWNPLQLSGVATDPLWTVTSDDILAGKVKEKPGTT